VLEGTVNEDLLEDFRKDRAPVWRIYEPAETVVVLGAGGSPPLDLILESLEKDGIRYRFRRGGGGTVVLSAGQTVLALVAEAGSPFMNREYAREINGWFVEALEGLGVRGVEHRGISDLAIREKKILGTSIYRSRLLLFYQASLLVSNDLALFDRYLKMPSRVPDYRMGRGHAEFCTSLLKEGYRITTEEIDSALGRIVEQRIKDFY
jgi:lipoate-protein ligase A